MKDGHGSRTAVLVCTARALLADHGFHAMRDEDLPEATERIAPALVARSRKVKHMRLVTAERQR